MIRRYEVCVLAGALALAGCASTTTGPSDGAPTESEAAAADTVVTPASKLPALDAATYQRVLGEPLAKPTAAGETAVLYTRLDSIDTGPLKGSLAVVLGDGVNAQLVFRADALAQLGLIENSPGPTFFASFVSLTADQLAKLQKNIDTIAQGQFGKPTNQSEVFAGRSPIGVLVNPTIDPSGFLPGRGGTPLMGCPVRPATTQQMWDQGLFITNPAVTKDATRTWDPCTGLGTPGGVWTFAHLATEMASGSGVTPAQFVTDWLSSWLNDYAVNGDLVPNRATNMFNLVIQPWEQASGGTATLTTDGSGHRTLSLSAPLDLKIAPFQLQAIVNRIDLGASTAGGPSYSGTSTAKPTTAGELRFIFNVVAPPVGGGSCRNMKFNTIFEYGVPITGCSNIVSYAQQWITLMNLPGVTAPTYAPLLQSMTESVVLHGSAPAKGNQNALDQLRTNEIELGGGWELREFTLTKEVPGSPGSDLPSNGDLHAHSLEDEVNADAFNASGDPTVASFMAGIAVQPTPPINPDKCSGEPAVPYQFAGRSFRAGRALNPPGFWEFQGLSLASSSTNICQRHVMSAASCRGCHLSDTGTAFQHIFPGTSPLVLSGFLTGGGPGNFIQVPDPQLGAALMWKFQDLERRTERLWDLAECTSCMTIRFPPAPAFLAAIAQLGPVPVEQTGGLTIPGKIGPVTDITEVSKLLDLRLKYLAPTAVDVSADVIRSLQSFTE